MLIDCTIQLILCVCGESFQSAIELNQNRWHMFAGKDLAFIVMNKKSFFGVEMMTNNISNVN